MAESYIDQIKAVHESVRKANTNLSHIWNEQIFLTWRWWLVVALAFLPWIAWAFLRKKDSSDRLIYCGMAVAVITSSLDSIGVPDGLWMYLVTPLPFIHALFLPWDFTVFPVTIMLLIQYKPSVSPFIKAVLFAMGTAFIFEPVFSWLKIYAPLHWRHVYSLPFYFVIYLIAHYVSRRNCFKPI